MSNNSVKYPNVTAKLTGANSNAFMLIGIVKRALEKAKTPPEEIKTFTNQAMNQGSYDELLCFLMSTVNIE